MTDQVTNPRYAYLRRLLQQVQHIQSQIQGQLRAPTEAMAGGEVWIGPKATDFKNALIFETNKYNRAIADLGTRVQEELNRTPEKCSAADVKLWRAEEFSG